MGVLNVLYQSDDNYSKYMGVSILSLLENNKATEDILIVIIDDKISQNVKDDLGKIVEKYGRRLQWIDAEQIRNDTVASLWPKYEGTKKNTNCYLKYFIFDGMLDESIDRIMYIDSDSLVLGSLDDLFTLDMQDKSIGMARCSIITKSYLESTGIGLNNVYFNSGMNLFDTKRWHNRQYSKKIIDMAVAGRAFEAVDQDLLNIVLKGDVIDIGCQYNYQYMHAAFPHSIYLKYYRPFDHYSKEELDAVNSPKIVHFLRFLGESPWNRYSVHPFTEMYEKYLKMSPWSMDDRLPSKNNGLSFRIGKTAYKILPKSFFLIFFKLYHGRLKLSLDKKAKKRLRV